MLGCGCDDDDVMIKILCFGNDYNYNVLMMMILMIVHVLIFISLPQNVGGWGYTGFTLSRRSVGPSVSNSCPLITLLLMEGFPLNLNDTFTSTRGCAEPMLPMCQVKVTVKRSSI